jgi:hypothetical protein
LGEHSNDRHSTQRAIYFREGATPNLTIGASQPYDLEKVNHLRWDDVGGVRRGPHGYVL